MVLLYRIALELIYGNQLLADAQLDSIGNSTLAALCVKTAKQPPVATLACTDRLRKSSTRVKFINSKFSGGLSNNLEAIKSPSTG